jgi:hypothetical protein
MKMTISRFTSKDISTSRGDATVLNFQANGKWFSAFRGTWNEDWRNGITIEVAESQIKTNEKNGKTYTNITAPAKAQAQAQGGNGASGAASDRVINALVAIYKDLQLIKLKLEITDEE